MTDQEIEHAQLEKKGLDGPLTNTEIIPGGKGGEVKSAPRLFADVEALARMTQVAAPP